ILGTNYSYTIEEISTDFEVFKHLKTYIVGSFSLAIISATLLGVFSYVFFVIFHKKINHNE
ncbi:DUF2062 domain-containing protein, partial [Aquimarina celericrescens]|nr:DUF2062 domain-containing protein [Aquimarina celericrescens]